MRLLALMVAAGYSLRRIAEALTAAGRSTAREHPLPLAAV